MNLLRLLKGLKDTNSLSLKGFSVAQRSLCRQNTQTLMTLSRDHIVNEGQGLLGKLL